MVMVKSDGTKNNGNAMLHLLSSSILLNLEILCFLTSDSIFGKTYGREKLKHQRTVFICLILPHVKFYLVH